MATNIVISPGSFDIQGPDPMDLRVQQLTLQDMYNITIPKRYVGLQVYVVETKKIYILRNGIGSYGVADDWEDLLPRATDTISGLIKVGTNLEIDQFGVLHASGGDPGDVTDGNKGDITVSNGGYVWEINPGVIDTTAMGIDITTAGKTLLTAAAAIDQRNALGLGDLATSTGVWINGAYVSGTNTGDEDLASIAAILNGDVSSHYHSQYATRDSPVFSGIVQLPWTTSIGNLSAQGIDYLSDITSSVQTQLNNRMPIDIQYSANLNSIGSTGDYKIVTGATNTPSGSVPNGSKLIHTNWDSYTARQIYYDYASDRIFTRRKVSNAWLAWNEIVLASTTPSSIRVTYDNIANNSYFDVPIGSVIDSIVLETKNTTGGTFTLTSSISISEVSRLVINSGVSSSGNVTVTLDGVAKNVAMTQGMPALAVASEIKNTSFPGWTTELPSSTTVIFTSTTPGAKTDATYSAGSTGAAGTMTTTTNGGTSSSNIVSALSIGTVIGVLKYLSILRPDPSMSNSVSTRMYVGITTASTVKLRVTTRLF